jgi:hypothetical protein
MGILTRNSTAVTYSFFLVQIENVEFDLLQSALLGVGRPVKLHVQKTFAADCGAAWEQR